MIFYKVKVTDKEIRKNKESINTTKFLFKTMQETLDFVKQVLDASLNSVEIIKYESTEEDNNGKKKNV